MNIGQTVSTNEYYKQESEMRFGNVKEIKKGIIVDIANHDNNIIATVKLENGSSRSINTLFLQYI